MGAGARHNERIHSPKDSTACMNSRDVSILSHLVYHQLLSLVFHLVKRDMLDVTCPMHPFWGFFSYQVIDPSNCPASVSTIHSTDSPSPRGSGRISLLPWLYSVLKLWRL